MEGVLQNQGATRAWGGTTSLGLRFSIHRGLLMQGLQVYPRPQMLQLPSCL